MQRTERGCRVHSKRMHRAERGYSTCSKRMQRTDRGCRTHSKRKQGTERMQSTQQENVENRERMQSTLQENAENRGCRVHKRMQRTERGSECSKRQWTHSDQCPLTTRSMKTADTFRPMSSDNTQHEAVDNIQTKVL